MRPILKKVYRLLPFKLQFFRLLRSIFDIPESIWKHLYFDGTFQVKTERYQLRFANFNSAFETSVFWTGTLNDEVTSVKIWSELSRHAQRVLDIGANTGFYALVAADVNKDADVIAFEPIDRIFQKLEKNVQLNGSRVRLEKFGVSDTVGEATIYDLPVDHHYHASLIREEVEHHEGVHPVTIRTTSVDAYMRTHDLSDVDLMKIDVEGHEVSVFSGMKETLSASKPSILLEVKDAERAAEINRMLDGLGYRFFELREGKGIVEIDGLGQSLKWNSLLLSPRHESVLSELPKA